MAPHVIADILFLAVFVFLTVFCACKGIIKILVKWLRLALSIFFAYTFGSLVGGLFKDAFFGKVVYNYVNEKVTEILGPSLDSISSMNDSLSSLTSSLPSFFMTDSVKASLSSSETIDKADIIDKVSQTISTPIANLLGNICGFIIIFGVSFLLIGILSHFLCSISESVKAFDIINHTLGGLFGLVISFVVLLIISWIIKGFFETEDIYANSTIVKFVGDKALTTFFKVFNLGSTLVARLTNY